MGRLVYVREVSCHLWHAYYLCLRSAIVLLTPADPQDRESEPRFTGLPPARGGYESGPPRGGYGGGYGAGGAGGAGGYGGPPASGGGRQIFINNVC